MTKNVHLSKLVVGKEYVFGSYSEILGFVPTACAYDTLHKSRLTIKQIGRKHVQVVSQKGAFDGEGFFEVASAKTGYRASLKARQAKGYPQTDAEINKLVNAL